MELQKKDESLVSMENISIYTTGKSNIKNFRLYDQAKTPKKIINWFDVGDFHKQLAIKSLKCMPSCPVGRQINIQ